MFSLLVLTLAVSAPVSAAAQGPMAPPNPLVVPSQPFVLLQPNGPMIMEEEAVQSFDDMAIHPGSEVCYKIRAFIFTTGQNPKFLRETTCGPQMPTAKKTDGTKPGGMPLELRVKSTDSPQE